MSTECQYIWTHKGIAWGCAKKKSIYTNEQKMMYDLLWGSNKASELFADCSSLKGLIIKYYSNFWTRIPVTLIWNHPFLLNTHILPHLPMDENFCRVLKLKIFPRGAAVLAPLIFGIFLEGRGMDYFWGGGGGAVCFFLTSSIGGGGCGY